MTISAILIEYKYGIATYSIETQFENIEWLNNDNMQ